MECATVYCDIDDYCTVLSKSRPRAIKEHKCKECKGTIRQGELYLFESLLFDGKVSTHKTCADCESIRENFFKDGFYYGDTQEMLHEHIRESYGDVSESCIASLTHGARLMVCSMIEAVWEDALDIDDWEQ